MQNKKQKDLPKSRSSLFFTSYFIFFAVILCIGGYFLFGNSTEVNSSTEMSSKYQQGVHYRELAMPIEADKNEVTEFFWYGCPHCYSAEPIVTEWAKGAKEYKLTKYHSQLSPNWTFDANVYFALKANGTYPLAHKSYFDNRQAGLIRSEDEMNKWLESFGMNPNTFYDKLESKKTQNLKEKLAKMERIVDAGGVPAFIVSGKYVVKLDGLSGIGGWKALPGLLEHLLNKAD